MEDNSSLFGYRKLIAWQRADELAQLVYRLTFSFPKEEIYGITSQLRRAILSVPLNIVEGHARNNKNEFRRFLSIALGSLAEAEYTLMFARKQNYISENNYEKVSLLRQETGHIIWKLYMSQK